MRIFDCFHRVDLCILVCLSVSLYVNVKSLLYRSRHTLDLFVIFDLLSFSCLTLNSIRLKYIENFYFHSIFFYSISIFNTCNRIMFDCPNLVNARAAADMGVSLQTLVPIHTMSNNRSWCWYVQNIHWRSTCSIHYNDENDDDDNNSCNCDWIYFDYQFFSGDS